MTEERAGYTVEHYAELESKIADSAPDEVTQLRRQVAQLVDRLDAAFRTIDGFTDASSFQWAWYQARIKELEGTVARLEADNKRLRKLDSIPLDALRRYCQGTMYMQQAAQWYDYMPDDYDADSRELYHWLATLDGDA